MSDKLVEQLGLSLDDIGRTMHESWCKTKRAQGFHGPEEPCTSRTGNKGPGSAAVSGESARRMCQRLDTPQRCKLFHPDLIPWEQLPEKQKDINCHAFDALLPLLTAHIAEREAAVREATIAHRYSPGDETAGCSCGWFEGVVAPDGDEYHAGIRQWEQHIRQLSLSHDSALARIQLAYEETIPHTPRCPVRATENLRCTCGKAEREAALRQKAGE